MNDYKLKIITEKLSGLTGDNEHTLAYHYLARKMGLKSMSRIFYYISRIQGIQGFLDKDLSNFRHSLYKGLLEQVAKKIDNKKQLDLIHDCL